MPNASHIPFVACVHVFARFGNNFHLNEKIFFKPKTRLIEGGCVVLHLDCSPTSERALCYKQGNKLKNNTVVQNISTFIELRIN